MWTRCVPNDVTGSSASLISTDDDIHGANCEAHRNENVDNDLFLNVTEAHTALFFLATHRATSLPTLDIADLDPRPRFVQLVRVLRVLPLDNRCFPGQNGS